jgi:hypothetical protein
MHEESTARLRSRIQRLEAENTNLKETNERLIVENGTLRNQIEEDKRFRKKHKEMPTLTVATLKAFDDRDSNASAYTFASASTDSNAGPSRELQPVPPAPPVVQNQVTGSSTHHKRFSVRDVEPFFVNGSLVPAAVLVIPPKDDDTSMTTESLVLQLRAVKNTKKPSEKNGSVKCCKNCRRFLLTAQTKNSPMMLSLRRLSNLQAKFHTRQITSKGIRKYILCGTRSGAVLVPQPPYG